MSTKIKLQTSEYSGRMALDPDPYREAALFAPLILSEAEGLGKQKGTSRKVDTKKKSCVKKSKTAYP